MLRFNFFVLFFVVNVAAHAQDELVVSDESCDFYLQLEDKRKCVEEGSNYLVDYGHKYCMTFRTYRDTPNAPVAFLMGTMTCLQNSLRDWEPWITSCPQLEAHAFNSHPHCYVENGFCDLPKEKKVGVLRQIRCIDLLFKPRYSIMQALSLLNRCTLDIDFDEFFGGTCTLI